MDYSIRWKEIEKIGGGGQGIVHRVLDATQQRQYRQAILNIISKKPSLFDETIITEAEYDSFEKGIISILQNLDMNNQGALKVLHSPKNGDELKKAQLRLKDEIKAMASFEHPNLLKILDFDEDEAKWYVSQYHPLGTLEINKLFVGNPISALKAIQPVVEGLSILHSQKAIHRDIAPKNIFIKSNGELVLGDFGLVFFSDTDHTRISETYENVGSRDWMPAWAQGIRIEELSPAFDVFCLGKTIWSMISGKSKLLLWYFLKDDNNLEKLFPTQNNMKLVNELLSKCIVEEERNCITTAAELSKEIQQLILKIERNVEPLIRDIPRRCNVCGDGNYELWSDKNDARAHKKRVYVCSYCGHIQEFIFKNLEKPSGWVN